MDDARWRQIDALLADALEKSGSDRDAFLDEACGDDQQLRRAVDRLLALEDEARSFLEHPDHLAAAGSASDAPLVGERIGPYRLVRLLGDGGMGSVYLGRREHDYEQEVAIKLVRQGLLGREVDQRFRTERQALAQLEHPNVARLYDGGTTAAGLPYLVMERIDGLAIDRYCDQHHLPLARRLELFQQVCSALSHAHRRLLVHCDIKPSNVMVTADGTPKLLDFGIAKLLRTEGSTAGEATRTDWRPLTPSYASPEQMLGEPITTASDVYSLGVLLYVLLSGRLPHRLASVPYRELLQIVEQDPERPSRRLMRTEPADSETPDPAETSRRRGLRPHELRRQLEGDLDAIVLKAIRREPAQRYASVDELSQDVGRHLEGRPVLARRGTWRYRTSKLLGRVFWPPDRRRRRERLWWAAILMTALGASWGLARLGAPEAPCADMASRLVGVWDDATRSSVRDAFVATGHPLADATWSRIAARLDAYGAAWARMHRETCEATEVYHEQSESMLDARMVCLDGRRAELLALAQLFSTADATIVAEADQAVAHLGDLAACADRAELSTLMPPPVEVEKRSAVGKARAVAEAQLARFHTRQPVDYDLLQRTAAEARELGYLPLVARLLYVRGLAEGMTAADLAASRTDLEEALLAAVSGGDRTAQTRIAAALVRILARQLGEPERARFWGKFAEASLVTVGAGHHEIEYEVAEALGLLAWETGDPEEATRHYQQALTVAEQASDPVRQIQALSSLGMFPGNDRYLERAIEISDRELGPNHALAARPLANLAASYGYSGRYDEGFELASRALSIMESTFGEFNPELGFLLTLLAQFRSSQGRPGEAIGYLERALPLVEARLGANANLVADVHHAYAQALHLIGRQDEALAHALKADRISAVSLPPKSAPRLWLLNLLGNIQREAGDLPAAIASHERLLALASGGPDQPAAIAPEMMLAIGETFTAAGRLGEAKGLLEKALQKPAKADAWTLAQLRFALAQALWPDDPLRARGLAEHASDGLALDPPLYRQFRERVHSWLVERTGTAD
jgi:serine/threonine protein kinase/tetratricopeptide (TPR) repeat protein